MSLYINRVLSFLSLLLVITTFSYPSVGDDIKTWECGLVDSTVKFTPNSQLFPPGKREEPLGCSSKPLFRSWIRKVSLDYMGLPQSADELFHLACVTHDMCYRHGAATYGKSKKDCDLAFAQNLNSLCNGIKDNKEAKKSCLHLPGLIHLGVKVFAGRYYRGKKKKLKSLYCEYLPAGDPASKWPYFWTAVQEDGSSFWRMIQERSGKNLVIRGQVFPIRDFVQLKQGLLGFFIGTTTEEQLVALIQPWVSEVPNMDTAEKAHDAFEAWVRVLEGKWKSQRNK